MYIGSKGNKGWKACIREIFQNAVDEMIRKESPCHYVKISFDERNQSATIEDTGRGIPHGKIVVPCLPLGHLIFSSFLDARIPEENLTRLACPRTKELISNVLAKAIATPEPTP